MVNTNNRVAILVTGEIYEDLKKLKIHHRETFIDILERVIEEYKKILVEDKNNGI